MTLQKFIPAAAALACLLAPLASQAQDSAAPGPWMVRVRAVHLDPANHDSTGLDLSINGKTIPEVDISYFFTPNWAAELILTVPQKHDIRSGGANIGSLKHLPPTLTAQYHFTKLGAFKPYLGAGVNYTRFSSVNFSPAVSAALQPGVDKSSVGLALQAGLDYDLGHNLVLNFDIKKLQLRTDVSAFGSRVGEFRVDPWLVGVGLGWRF
jgi:outer membrane protein